MNASIEMYLERLRKIFPGLVSFGNGSEEFDKNERNFKLELVALYRTTVASSLKDFPEEEAAQIDLGKRISALFTTPLTCMGKKPQNLVGYRYWDPLKFDGTHNARWAQLVRDLITSEDNLKIRIDTFVAGLRDLIALKIVKNNKVAFTALSRSITSFLLMLADPQKHIIIKTQEFNRALKAFSQPVMDNEPLTGKEYLRIQLFIEDLRTQLEDKGLNPRDMIDVQSFIWVGDGKSYQTSEQYWLLGANWDGNDMTKTFIDDGRWENGYQDKLLEKVRAVKKGDRVAIKSSYTKKLGLPFNSLGKTISCMEIKARGVVKDNPGDGRHLAIEWETDFEPKIIYFYTYRSTIDPIDKSKYKDTTIAWVFGDIEQDITWLEEQAALANGSFVLGHSEDTNLNRILFGPPGTGKTYRSVEEALSILDPACLQANSDNRTALKSRFDELVSTGDICFVTFHQSFSYEDFVEGLRAVTNPDGSLAYKVENGVFKTICDSAGALSLENCSELPDGLEDGLANSTQKDGLRLGDAIGNSYKIGKVSSDLVLVEKKGGSSVPFTWDFLNELTELVRSKAISLGDIEKGQVFDKLPNVKLEKYLLNGYSNIVHDLVEKLVNSRSNVDFSPNIFSPIESPKVLIIDEINRGNVSRIFGELITLIEVSKRRGNAEALEVILPYSKMRFSVPRNVYLIGTMNTADRSLMGLDIALRRRFSFIELPPKPDMLDSVVVENINIGTLLRLINERIEVLLDRDHCLGHTYFLPLKEMENPSLKDLATVFRQHILPLLQEYFFEDWERIHFVLNDHRKASPEHCFISRPTNKVAELFGDKEGDRFLDNRWVINEAAFDLPESYLGVIGVHE